MSKDIHHMRPAHIEQQARKELDEENFREAVDVCKEEMRRKKPLLHRLLPFKITITKR